MSNPNEIWEDGQSRRTVSLSHELLDYAKNRSKDLDYNSFSEYIRWLIISDKRHNILDPYELAKMEIKHHENELGERPRVSFWRK